jgi:hypothetical protein
VQDGAARGGAAGQEAVITELEPQALAFVNSAAEALLDTKTAMFLPRAKLESFWTDLESTYNPTQAACRRPSTRSTRQHTLP